jgi:hypothetical protein
MYENLPPLELWFPNIRKYLYKTIGKQIVSQGFKFNKSEFSYKRKHGKDYEELCFILKNQFPINYRISFILKIWNHQIKAVKASFPHKDSIENFKYRSLVLFMGNFLEEMNSPPTHPGTINDFTLITNRDLFTASDRLIELFHDRVLPMSMQVSNVAGIDAFFESRPGWSVNNLTLNNITSDLIAARLNAKRNFDEVFWDLRERMGKKITAGEMNLEARIAIELLYKYLKNNY